MDPRQADALLPSDINRVSASENELAMPPLHSKAYECLLTLLKVALALASFAAAAIGVIAFACKRQMKPSALVELWLRQRASVLATPLLLAMVVPAFAAEIRPADTSIRVGPAVKPPQNGNPSPQLAGPLLPTLATNRVQLAVVLPPLAPDILERLKGEDARGVTLHTKGRLRIGIPRTVEKPIVVSRGTVAAAEWTFFTNGWRICSVGVSSQGTIGIRVHLEKLALPAGTRLIVYNPSRPAPTTPIVAEALFGEREAWTDTIFAENVVVECQVPPGVEASEVAFVVTGVSQIYQLPKPGGPNPQGAEPCENDVTCYPAWANPAVGVALISFIDSATNWVCTGCLLNTIPTTLTDYFLTANHCVNNQTVASTLNVYWFYQTSVCN